MAECIHEWQEWEKMLWYTPQGRFVGEARRCNKCPAVETRNVEINSRPAVVQLTIGVFAGIFNKEGKLLLKKITSGRFAGEWDLPGGGIRAAAASKTLDERIILQELSRQVWEEVGIYIPGFSPMVAMYPAVLKGGGDIGFAILIGISDTKPSKGETKYVSPQELRELAEGPEGNRLLSGWGKRMCRLCLMLFASGDAPNREREHAKEAERMLAEIQKGW